MWSGRRGSKDKFCTPPFGAQEIRFFLHVKTRGPIEEIKIGSVVIPIYKTPGRKGGKSYPGFTARYYDRGEERRIYSSDLEKLRQQVREMGSNLAGRGSDALVLRGTERVIHERATDIASSIGMKLDQAAQELSDLRKMEHKAGCSAAEVFAFYRKHHNNARQATPLPEVAEAFIADKEKARNSTADLRDLRLHIGWLADRFKAPLRDIGPDDWDAYFGQFNVNPVTLAKYRGSVSRLINWAKERGYLPHDHRGLPRRTSKVKHRAKREPLVTIADRERIIQCAAEKHRPAVLLAAFAPIRTCELGRASFEDIDWERRSIVVYADDAKVRETRFIGLVPELVRRLEPYRGMTGRITQLKYLSGLWTRLAKTAKVPWRKNGWRKAVLSHLASFTQNYDGVAAQAGTSVQKLKSTYLTAVNFEAGCAWFGLGPNDHHPLRPVALTANTNSATGKVASDGSTRSGCVVPFPANQRVA